MNKHQEAYGRIIDSSNLKIHVENGLPMNQYTKDVLLVQELVDKHEKIKKALNKIISERINETGKVLEREEISYIQALQFVLKLLDWSEYE